MRAVTFGLHLVLFSLAVAEERPCGSYPADISCVRSEIILRSRAQAVYPLDDDENTGESDEVQVVQPNERINVDEPVNVQLYYYNTSAVHTNVIFSGGESEIVDFVIWDEGYVTITVDLSGFSILADYEAKFFVPNGLPYVVSSNMELTNIDATITTMIPGTIALDIDNALTRPYLKHEFDYDFGQGLEDAAAENEHIAGVMNVLNAEPWIFQLQMAEAYAPLAAKIFFNRNVFIYTGK